MIKIHQRDSESRRIGKIKAKRMSFEEMARIQAYEDMTKPFMKSKYMTFRDVKES